MRQFLVAPLLALSVSASPAGADEVDDLYAALALPEMVAIMREEGIAYGAEIGEEMFPGAIGTDWEGIVSEIYDADRMDAQIRADFAAALEGEDLGPMLDFFTAEPGRTIISLEASARRALLDDDLEEAAKEMAAMSMADRTARFQQIERFAEVNDLIETNVVSAMNSNFAFYTGLMDGGAFDSDMTEDQVLQDVWSQEPQIRQTTTEWVYSFLTLAYEPLPEADLETYIEFSQTDVGQELNKAIFQAFDGTFEAISHSLGQAASRYVVGQQL